MHTSNDIIISHVMGKSQSLLVPRQLQLAIGFSRANLPEEERESRRHRMADRKSYNNASSHVH